MSEQEVKELDLHGEMLVRREKLAALRAKGNAFPNQFRRDALAQDLHDKYEAEDGEALKEKAIEVTVAGRIMTRRAMGKATFITLQDMSGKIQLYVARDNLPEGVYAEDVGSWDLGDIIGVKGTLFKTKTNELTIKTTEVLPISLVPSTHYLHICRNPENTDIYIVLLLDSKKIEERLALAASSHSERTLYIADAFGTPLSLSPNSSWYETVSDECVQNSLRSCTKSEGFKQVLDENQYSLYSIPLDFCGLNLVSIVPKTSLHTRLARMSTFLLLISLAGLMLTAFLSLILSRFLTRPLARLIQNVHRIENNTYDTPDQMKYKDEIGQLNMAINSMYKTIQEQIQQIRENERDKYQAEIQLLSAQISPHFLYNTLECINMEILSDRKQTASAMITSLGDFMRIGLNYGNELIPLSRELLHVKSYIDIMNYRFSQKIELISTIPPELTDCLILKSILQPLAENSIRHGFNLDESGCIPVPMPEISVNVFENNGILTIEVIDNGHGIDISRANEALSRDGRQPCSKHVGLNNVYARLKACYGTAQIHFETIPYFRNVVRIAIPYKIAKNNQKEIKTL